MREINKCYKANGNNRFFKRGISVVVVVGLVPLLSPNFVVLFFLFCSGVVRDVVDDEGSTPPRLSFSFLCCSFRRFSQMATARSDLSCVCFCKALIALRAPPSRSTVSVGWPVLVASLLV